MRITTTLFVLLFSLALRAQDAAPSEDAQFIRKIYDEALANGQCYKNLGKLCKVAPNRLSGSPGAEKAVQFCKNVMEGQGLKVKLQEVLVPHWVRGTEKAFLTGKTERESKELTICALGGSIGTPEEGIMAEVIEVQNFDELEALGEAKVKGKIVFYNRPFDPTKIQPFQAYGGAVNQRSSGASKAAKYGAVATLVRSMTTRIYDFPHTGAMHYEDGVKKIPSAAISTLDAEFLSKILQKNGTAKVSLQMSCETLPDVTSHNVIGELKGSPGKEYIAVGGHLDAWDKGEGAHDDGAGCTQAIEALRILDELGYTPKRTLRAVMWMNEENGLRGGKTYAKVAKETGEKHLAAIESDAGGFTPRGFAIDDSSGQKRIPDEWKKLLEPYGLHQFPSGFSGADIGPLKDQGFALLGYRPDPQRYFDFHHCDTDVFSEVNQRELELGAASLAAIIYLIDKYGI